MKASIKTIQRCLLTGVLFLLTFAATAQTTYQVYLCGDGSVKLIPDFGSYNLQVGDEVIWVKLGTTNTTVASLPITNISQDVSHTVDAADLTTDGEHSYNVFVISVDGCSSDPSEDYIVYKLPDAAIDFSSNIATYCAANSGDDTEALLTASMTPTTLPADIEYIYDWSATDANGSVDISTIGTLAGNEFTLNTATASAYTFTVNVKYAIKSTSSAKLKSGVADDGCVVTATETVTVTDQPTKPTISIL